MICQEFQVGYHEWEKQNLITQKDRKGSCDFYKCRRCGLKGKSRLLGLIEINSNSIKKAKKCPNRIIKNNVGREIEITYCSAVGDAFSNCTSGSKHKLIEPPKDREDRSEVWIMGVGEPIRLMDEEFKFID